MWMCRLDSAEREHNFIIILFGASSNARSFDAYIMHSKICVKYYMKNTLWGVCGIDSQGIGYGFLDLIEIERVSKSITDHTEIIEITDKIITSFEKEVLDMNNYQVIVGCGIAGAVLARRLAEETGQEILIIEKKNYIGGFCYDYRNENGILIHKHGPHIFRTESEKVWRFLSRFTQWEDYQHKVLSNVNGQLYPMPINLDTVNQFLGTSYTAEDIDIYFETHRTNIREIKCVKDVIESQIGSVFYHAFFEKYTKKQWGLSCEELPPEIVARIPIRKNRDDRYFTHKYQALPKEGYTKMIENIISHPNIRIMLNTDFKEIKELLDCEHIYYSGSIDEYYDYCFGRLPYRSVTFKFETYPIEQYQPVSVVNYPNNYDYTRITEFKHFYRKASLNTVIAKEIPGSDGDPSYPIPTKANNELYQKYAAIANDKVTFIGRLGEYHYYSMDQIVDNMLKMDLSSQ